MKKGNRERKVVVPRERRRINRKKPKGKKEEEL